MKLKIRKFRMSSYIVISELTQGKAKSLAEVAGYPVGAASDTKTKYSVRLNPNSKNSKDLNLFIDSLLSYLTSLNLTYDGFHYLSVQTNDLQELKIRLRSRSV